MESVNLQTAGGLRIVGVTADEADLHRAFEVLDQVPNLGHLELKMQEGAWTLNDSEGRKLCIDFDRIGGDYNRRAPRGKNEIIGRALGLHKGIKRVIDATAGLGQDAVFLAQLRIGVIAIERHPLLSFLLAEARRRCRRVDLDKLEFIAADACTWLASSNFADQDTAIYLDPMYPDKKKSALPRQEMVLFRHLVGDDADGVSLLRTALQTSAARVVVKRPLKAEYLDGPPIHSFEGSSVRYDVYVRS